MTIFHLGLIGYPLGYSFSPQIHTTALASCGLEGDYSLFPIRPDDHQGLKDLLTRVRTGEITGLNVTIPHKQNVIPLLDELTPTAKVIGAVNTIFLKDGKLTGDNTDAPGFLADSKKFLTTETLRHGPSWPMCQGDAKSALILGAGGAARAVVYALANDGWEVTIAARRPEQAQELATLYGLQVAESLYLSDPMLIVNTTPVGMSPDIETSPWPADLSLPSQAVVYDLVYNPRETKLVRDARLAGLLATSGIGMLIEQAALSFQIWTGCIPSRDTLTAAIH